MPADVVLPDADPRDREVQHVVLKLVEAYAFEEAAAVLNARLREVRSAQQSHLETLFLSWSALPADARADFLTFAHHRRRPGLERATDE